MKSKSAFRLVHTGTPAAIVLASAIAALLAPSTVRATDFAWDPLDDANGGGGTWDTTSLYWDSGNTPTSANGNIQWANGAANNAFFGGSLGTVTLGTSISVGTLNFSIAGYSINTGINTLTLNSANTGTAGIINFDNAGTLALVNDGDNRGSLQNVNFLENVSVASNAAISVNRAGAVALNKTLQLGGLTIGANTLTLTNSNGYGLEFAGATTLTDAATFSVGTANSSNVVKGLVLTGPVTGGFGLTKSGVGTLVLGSALNTFGSGGSIINVTDGILQVSSNGALGDGGNGVSLSANSATQGLRLAGGTAASPAAYTLTGRGINLNAAASGIDVTGYTTATLDTNFASSVPTNTLQKNDNGVLAFASGVNNSTLTGAWTINAGAIRIADNLNLNAAATAMTVANRSALQLTSGTSLSRVGTFTLNGSGLDSAGALESVSGANSVTSLITLGSATTIGADADTLNISGSISGAFGLTFNAAGSSAITISTTAINANVTALNKIGTGSLIFDVASPLIVAPINLNAGTFEVRTGVLGGTGAISAGPGATIILTSTTANRLGGRALNLNASTLHVSGAAAETTGLLTINSGHSTIINTSGNILTLGAAAPVRNYASSGSGAGGTLLFKGGSTINFGATPTFIGQTGATGVANKGILPWGIFDDGVNPLGFATANSTGTATVRGLAAGEYATNLGTGNANVVLSANPTWTSSVTLNSITFNAGSNAVAINSPTLTAPAIQTLTLSSGGLLSNVTGASISGGVLALGTQMVAFTPGSSDLTITSAVTGGGGVAKAGAGTLTLSSTTPAYAGYSANTITNTDNNRPFTEINEGKVVLGANNALGYARPGIQVYTGATLDLNGKMQWASTLSSQLQANAAGTVPGVADGGIVTSASSGSLVLTMQNSGATSNNTFSGSIQGSGVGLARTGESGSTDFLVLRGNNTYTGPTLINGGGTGSNTGFVLRDGGRTSGTTSLDINYAGFTIDNTALSNNYDRVNDLATVGLRGASLYFLGRAQMVSTETLGVVTLDQGRSIITVTPGGTGINSADLTLTTLGRSAASGGVVNFAAGSGTLGTIGSNPHIAIGNGTSLVVNNVIPWATVGTDFASYISYGVSDGASTGGVGALNAAGYAGYDATSIPGADQLTQNIKTGGAPTLSASVKLNSLNTTANGINFTTGAEILNLNSGGLIAGGSIGASVDSGRLAAGGDAASGTSDLLIFNIATLNARIIDTATAIGSGTGKTRLVLSNSNVTMGNANNSYTGGTVFNANILTLNNASSGVVIPNATVPADGLVLNSATLTMTNSAGQIGAGNIVTLNGNSTLTLFGNNTFEGLVVNFNGTQANSGSTINTFTTGSPGALTLGASGITTTSSVLTPGGGVPIITGLVNLASSSTLNIGGATFNGQLINPLRQDFTLTGLGGGGGITTKSGTGMLQLNASAVLLGTLDVTGGGLQIGAAGAGARLADVVLENGTRINLNGNAGLFGSLATPVSGTGLVTNTGALATLTVGANGNNSSFAGSFTRFNDATVNLINLNKIGTGTMTLTGNTSTASGSLTINSSGGGGVTFSGNGVNNFLAAAVAINMGGALNLDNGTPVVNRLASVGMTLSGGTINATGGNADESGSVLTANLGLDTIVTGANTLSVKSFTRGAGGTLNIGTSTVKFMSTAPTLTNSILPGVFVGNDFATVSATNTPVTAYSAYATGDLGTTGASTDNFEPTGTQTHVTASKTINSLNLTLQGGIAEGVTLSSGQTLTLGAGSLINNGGGNITGGILSTSGNAELIANYATDGSISSIISGTSGGLTKLGAGNLTLGSPDSFTGQTSVNQGTLTLAGGNNTLAANNALRVNYGGTLDLGTNNQYVNTLASAGTVEGSGGSIIGSGRLTTNAANGTFAGNIGGSVSLVKAGANTLTLPSAQTTTGTLSVIGGGLTLKDGGTLSGLTGTSAISLNYATLTLDNTGFKDLGNRVNDDAPITMNGGTLTYLGRAATASTETLGTLTLAQGLNVINVTPASNGSADLTLGSFTRPAGSSATVQFNPGGTYGLGGFNPRINISGATPASLTAAGIMVNGIIPSAITSVPGAFEFVSYIPYTTVNGVTSGGIGALVTTGYPGNTAGAPTNVNAPTANYRNGGFTITGNVNINSLYVTGGTQTVAFTSGAEILNLTAGALMVYGPTNIGATVDSGRLTAGNTATAGTTVDLYTYNQDRGITMNSRIIDNPNGAKVRLVESNGGGLTLSNPNNSYTGGTVVNANALNLNAATAGFTVPNATNPTDGLVINNATVNMTVRAGQIGSGNIVTLNGGSTLTLFGNNTLAGLVFSSNGGTTTPTVTPAGVLTLTGDISSTPTNVAVTPVISGGTLDLSGATPRNITVASLGEGNFYRNGANWAPLKGLAISSVIQNGAVTKKGTGVLELSGTNTFNGQLTVEDGTVSVGSVNNVSSNGVLGNNALSVILGQTGGQTGTLEYTGNSTSSTKPFTMASGGTGAFQVDASGQALTLSGLIDGSGGLVKTGPGTLTLSGNNTYSGASTVSTGTLKAGLVSVADVSGAFGLNSAVTMANTDSATMDITGFNTQIGALSGGGTLGGNVTLGAATLTCGGDNNVAPATYAGVISGTGGGLTKIGTGTQILTGTNTYTGGTTVTGGTLLVNNTTGSGTGSGAVNVDASGTLGGTGSIAGAVNVTGVLSPGASIETLASGALTLNNLSTLACQVNSSVSHTVGAALQKVAGDLSLNGTVTLNLTDIAASPAAFTAGTVFSLINYTGVWNSGIFSYLATPLNNGDTFTAGLNTWKIIYDAADGGANFSGEYAGGTDSFVNLSIASSLTPYQQWAKTYITDVQPGANADPSGDPDNDGVTNLTEFAIGGNPLNGSDRGFIFGLTADSNADPETVSKEIILTVAVRKTAPAFSTGSPSTSTVDGIKYSIEGSTNLTSWTVGVTPVTAITTGLPALADPVNYEYRSFSLDGSNGLTVKGFLRAMVEMP